MTNVIKRELCRKSEQQIRLLTEKASKAVIGTRDASLWMNINENIVAGVNENAKMTSAIKWAVEQHQKTLHKININITNEKIITNIIDNLVDDIRAEY